MENNRDQMSQIKNITVVLTTLNVINTTDASNAAQQSIKYMRVGGNNYLKNIV